MNGNVLQSSGGGAIAAGIVALAGGVAVVANANILATDVVVAMFHDAQGAFTEQLTGSCINGFVTVESSDITSAKNVFYIVVRAT